jgi:methionine transaminase
MKNYSAINSKLPGIKPSIFSVMTKLALDYNAINLSQGFPDFNCPPELINLVEKYIRSGNNQYAPMRGVKNLREQISKKILKLYGRFYDPESEIIITAGATQAIFTTICTVINKGDEVIIFQPAYDSYAPSVVLNGGIPVFIPLNNNDYSINWDEVKDRITSRTRMIIINSPHNPTGSVISVDDLNILKEITASNDILILSDEVYEHIVFDGKTHNSISGIDDLASRSFVISSFGKTYHATGWKLGYCTAPENLMEEFAKVHQFNVFSVNTPMQFAYADFMQNESYYLSLNTFYQRKRDIIIDTLTNSNFKFKKTDSTYFQLLDYSDISDLNDMDFAKFLIREAGVAVIPLSPFCSEKYSEKIIRICFAKNDDVLRLAMEKLISI